MVIHMNIEPIGTIKTDFDEKFGIPRQSGRIEGLSGLIEFFEPFCSDEYFKGIEQFSHIWVIWGFSENVQKKKHATVRPPRLGGNKRIGVFASRSPFRPNNLALSCVALKEVRRDKGVCALIIDGADMLDGSPVYDIKPYVPYSDCIPQAAGGFADGSKDYSLEVSCDPKLLEKLPESKRAVLIKVLADDPRPAYQEDESRIYGLSYAGFEIKFRVDGKKLAVTNIFEKTNP